MGRTGRLIRTAAIVSAVLAVPFLVIWHEQAWWWVEVHTGTVNESGPYYGFFSGFGSDIGEVAIIGGLVAIVRKHNCHVHNCWRIGRHPVEGTPYVVCRRHHPEGHLTAEKVKEG